MLLVSFNLWKETIFCSHCSPEAGESGWTYSRLGISGSALPATVHLPLWNLYLLSSIGTMSIMRMYFDFLSSPFRRILKAGNILLHERERERGNE